MVTDLAIGPDSSIWVTSTTTIAVLREGAWSEELMLDNLGGLVVAPDGTLWVKLGRELFEMRWVGPPASSAPGAPVWVGYSARKVPCPKPFSRFAVTTDGIVYLGSFSYSDGWAGLVSWDGISCVRADPVGDGRDHDVAALATGPDGSLLATVFDDTNGNGPYPVWVVLLRNGRWSTISGPTNESGVIPDGVAFAPDGRPWAINADGLVRYADGAWELVAAGAQSLAMAPDGVLWYQTERGLERISTSGFGE
jgi:hypothetical protein